ncbi:MAG: helix-turn-helix domain-containing protein [Bacteroidetes bacterium]|nr:MAG: helix-turn-helix domain-containing protein [Bacteroidota bacterium]
MNAHRAGRSELPPENIHFAGEPDPRQIRAQMQLSQEDFAHVLGISVRTLQNWEQGRRRPTGPAMKLLRIAERHPELLLEMA